MSRFLITADWDNNAPHLTPEAKRDLIASIPAYQRDARTKGIPQLGAGVIYPILEEDILVDAFTIPKHWLRGYGLDVGWKKTAAIWRAKDPDTKISYLYDEYYRSEADPTIHGAAIRRRGKWIPGRIDPAGRGRSQIDGKKLLRLYREAIYEDTIHDEGDNHLLGIARNAVESGIYDVLMALNGGTLKVMRHRCPNWLAERRLYRRNEKGEIIKNNDHAQDAGRYCVASGDAWLLAEPIPVPVDKLARFASGGHDESLAWMGSV